MSYHNPGELRNVDGKLWHEVPAPAHPNRTPCPNDPDYGMHDWYDVTSIEDTEKQAICLCGAKNPA